MTAAATGSKITAVLDKKATKSRKKLSALWKLK